MINPFLSKWKSQHINGEKNHNVINLFGHIHSGPNADPNGVDQNLTLHQNQMDVGTDAWNYKPISLDFINSILKK